MNDLDHLAYRDLLDQLSDGVYLVDRHRRIGYWNRAAVEMTGYSAEEVTGRCCADNLLVHVDECGTNLCQSGCPVAATIKDGEQRRDRVFLHHKDGHRVPVMVRTSAIRDPGGTIIGAIEVFSDATPQQELEARLEELERMAMLDQLTELPNRRYLEMGMTARLDELARYEWPFGVLLMDIDHFKQVNDVHGHATGDRVLKMVGRTLAHSARVFDLVGRWGGEEFLVVLANTRLEEVLKVGERFRAMVEASHLTLEDGTDVSVTLSAGAAAAVSGEAAETLLERVDERLYEAKEQGRNRVVG